MIMNQPKRINNEVLLDEKGEFKITSKKNTDYYKLNPHSWFLLQKLYGGNPVIL